MSSDKLHRRALMLALLALPSCGFAPIYGENQAARGVITFETDATPAGFAMRQRLAERLGSGGATYLLNVSQTARERAAAINDAGDTTRFNVVGTARWRLSEIATGKTVASGQADAFTSYAATGSTVATQSTRDDAVRRLAIIHADMITSRILLLSLDAAP